jgi:hypothetical protein
LQQLKTVQTFSWDPNAGTGVGTRATIIAGNPTATVLTRVSDRDRHLIHFGTETTIGSYCNSRSNVYKIFRSRRYSNL